MTERKWRNRIVGYGECPPEELVANPYNWRVHPAFQQNAVLEVLEEVGWVQDVIINQTTGNMVDGHLRAILALRHEEPSVPYKLIDVTEEEERLILATLDPLGGLAGTDSDKVRELLEQVETNRKTVRQMLSNIADRAGGVKIKRDDPGPELSRAEELQQMWGTELGQVWQIGAHRLMIGDSGDPEQILQLLGGLEATLLMTSPPYWMGKEYEQEVSEDDIDDAIATWVTAWMPGVAADYGRIVINTGTAAIHRIDSSRKVEVLPLIDKWQMALHAQGWLLRHLRIWTKSGEMAAPRVAPRSDVVDQRWEHLATFEHDEMELDAWSYMGTFWQPQGLYRGQERTGAPWAQQGVWSGLQGDRSAGGLHVAAFPVELPRRYIRLYTKDGEGVLDPFVGSGSTLVACEELGRAGYGMELSPAYAAAALERLSGMGLEPRLLGENR